MRNKLKFLIRVSLARKVKTKWFLVAQIVLLFLLIGMFNMDIIINSFTGEFKSTTTIYIVDETKKAKDIFEEAFLLNEKNLYGDTSHRYEVKEMDTVENLEEKIKEEEIVIHLLPDSKNILSVEVTSSSTIDTYTYNFIYSASNSTKVVLAMEELGLTFEDYTKIMSDVSIKTYLIDESIKTEAEGTAMIMDTVFPILIMPIFMLSIFLVQMVGAEVNDEKSTKAMEIIISNVSPKTHFFAKVIAGNVFVVGQTLLGVLYGGIALGIRNLLGGGNLLNSSLMAEMKPAIDVILKSSLGDKLIYILPAAIVLILLTFVAYALVAGVLASMTATTEDYQQVQLPIVLVSFLGYYLAVMAGMFKGSIVIKVFSFVPFISAILSPSLLVLGQIGFVEMLISILIMVGTIFLLVKYGLRIYKVGILNYSSSDMWKKMFKALKKNSTR